MMKVRPALLLLFLILFLVPFFGSHYLIYVIGLALVYGIAAVGLDILMGYCGQVCFSQAGFVAVGAYATAFLVKNGLSYWVSLPIGGIVAALAGLMIGIPALRIRGHYLALATLSFAYIIHLILIHWERVTGGPRGLIAARPSWPISFDEKYFYFVILFIVIPLFIVARNIVNSKYGRAFLAIQKDEIISKSMGINLTKYKTLAFVISSLYAGIGGGLYGPLIGFLDPLSFTFIDSCNYVVMIVLGGRGTLYGAFIGAAFFTILPEVLRGAEKWQELFFGLIFICFLIFMPNGVMGLIRRYQFSLIERFRKMSLLRNLFEE
jgi:branched-chain amino acid transport system permease protein